MTTRWNLRMLAVAMVLGALLWLASGCGRSRSPVAPRTVQTPIVTAISVTLGSITQRIEVTGDVRPLSTVMLAPKVGGRLERLGLDDGQGGYRRLSEGTVVRRGDVVAWIDLATYEARFKQAEAAFAMAQAQFHDAEREAERVRVLHAEGSATQQMLDKAMTAKDLAAAALAQAEAALALARIEYAECRLASPVDGVVTHKYVDEGNLVGAGTPLAAIEEVSQVKIVLGIPERYLPAMKPNETCVRLFSAAFPEGMAEAMVSKVYPAVDPATRNGTIEVLIDNAEGRLRSGQFVRAWVDVAYAEETVVIPLSAITWQGKEGFVFIVDNGTVRRRPVRTGIREGDRCQILEGLMPGDQLVVSGLRSLKEGDSVSVESGGQP